MRPAIADIPEGPAPAPRRFAREAVMLALAMLPAVGARLYVLAHTDNIARDGVLYLQMAHQLGAEPFRSLAEGYDFHPGYPAAVAGVARSVGAGWPGGWVLAAQWVSLAWSLVALACLYAVGRAAFSRPAALATVLLAGLSNELVLAGCDVRSESQTAALVLLSVALGLAAARRLRASEGWAVALAGGAGLSAGAAYLARPEGALAAVVVAALLLSQPLAGRRSRLIQLSALAALAAAAVACAAPYAAVIGGFTRKKAVADLVAGPGAAVSLAGYGAAEVIGALRRLLDRSRQVVGTVPTVLAVVCWSAWLAKTVFPRRLAALEVLRPTRDGAVAMFLPAVVMAPLLMGMQLRLGPAYISTRHAMLPALLAAPCAGAGLEMLVRWTLSLAPRLHLPARPILARGGWLLALSALMLPHAFCRLHEGKALYRQAGLEIRRRLGPGQLLWTDDARVAFYAEAPPHQFINNSPRWYHLLPRYARRMDEFVPWSRPYDAVAISSRFLPKLSDSDLISNLPADQFIPLGTWRSPDGKERLWVFRTR